MYYIIIGTLSSNGHFFVTLAPLVEYKTGVKQGSFIAADRRIQREVQALDKYPIGKMIKIDFNI